MSLQRNLIHQGNKEIAMGPQALILSSRALSKIRRKIRERRTKRKIRSPRKV